MVVTQLPGIKEGGLDPYDPAFHENPYPTYAWLRDEEPVHHSRDLGFYAISRYDDVHDLSRQHDTFISGKGTVLEMMGVEYDKLLGDKPMLLFTDPPYHEQLRRLVSHAFIPKSIQALKPAIDGLVTGLVERLEDGEQVDLVTDFAAPLPMNVIFEMLGVPEEDRLQVREWVDRGLDRTPEPPYIPEYAMEAQVQANAYYEALVADRAEQRRDDMISTLLDAQITLEDGSTRGLSHGEIIGFIGLLSGAGNETVTKLISNALVLLHRFPDQRRLVTDDLERVPDLVEEALRYWAPSQYQGRTATRDVTLHGTTIPADAKVILISGAANRDERKFADPDRFDIDRPNKMDHVSFGTGIHFCLGASLARIEARTALGAFLEHFPAYEVDEDGIEHVHSSNVHGFEHVPATL